MLRAIILKVERNPNDPQIDVVVNFFDEETKFQREQVFTFPVDEELTFEKVENAVQISGKELKSGLSDTIQKEVAIRDEFQGKEIVIK